MIYNRLASAAYGEGRKYFKWWINVWCKRPR